ncbi:MAG: YggT family protein [Actinobacteria bacterium]|nr:YggT family protein [Actinomycetota bacterium]MBO0786627.1 YggT family protein [Actinomycetota bacterium]
MGIVVVVLTYLLWLYLLLLVGRLIFSWIQAFSRSWRPTGPVLVIAEAVFTATDPPLRLLRRFIPVVRLGTVALDLSFMVLFFLILLLIRVVALL